MTSPGHDTEDAWLARAFQILTPADTHGVLEVGLGDDAASVRLGEPRVVVATDVLVDGVHFDLDQCGPEAAASKALKVNLSDLAAMGAAPLAFLVGGVLPKPADRQLFDGLMRGFAAAGRTFGCACAGGDTNVADGPLVLAVTVLGQVGPRGPVLRAGAKPGDVLSVTGPLGGSRAGRHLTFTPRLGESRALCAADVPHAMIDLSDGLGRDLPRLCRASGVGARIDASRVPIHPDATAAAKLDPDGTSALGRALGDGEDFELLVAHAPLNEDTRGRLGQLGVDLIEIGRVTADLAVLCIEDGAELPLVGLGYDHVLGAEPPPDSLRWIAEDTASMERIGARIAAAVRPIFEAGFVIDLRGELGAGKTVLVRGLARAIGIPARVPVTSPTFTVARRYEIPAPDGDPWVLEHVDAYRMGAATEIEFAGFEEMCGERVLTCVEWGGRVEAALPEDRLEITLELLAPDTLPTDLSEAPELARRVTLRALGPTARDVLDRLRESAP